MLTFSAVMVTVRSCGPRMCTSSSVALEKIVKILLLLWLLVSFPLQCLKLIKLNRKSTSCLKQNETVVHKNIKKSILHMWWWCLVTHCDTLCQLVRQWEDMCHFVLTIPWRPLFLRFDCCTFLYFTYCGCASLFVQSVENARLMLVSVMT